MTSKTKKTIFYYPANLISLNLGLSRIIKESFNYTAGFFGNEGVIRSARTPNQVDGNVELHEISKSLPLSSQSACSFAIE